MATTTGLRIGWVDFAKGLAMLAVVYFHVTLFLGYEGVDNALGRAKLAFELFPMPAFFLLSGLWNRRSTTWSFPELWRRRLLPILYLYVVWSMLRFAFYLVFPFLETDAADMAPTDPRTLLLLPVLPTSSYWFVYALALFTLAAWLLRRVNPVVQLVLAAALSTAFTTGLLDTNTIAWNRICALFFFFLLGSLESRRIRVLVGRASVLVAVVSLLALAALIAGMFFYRGAIRWPFYVLAGQLLAVFVVFQASRVLARLRWLDWVSLVGRQSLAIYLIHLFAIAPIAALIGLLRPDWPRFVDIAVCVAVTAVVVLICLLVARASSRLRWLYTPPRWLAPPPRRVPAASTRPAAQPADSKPPPANAT